MRPSSVVGRSLTLASERLKGLHEQKSKASVGALAPTVSRPHRGAHFALWV